MQNKRILNVHFKLRLIAATDEDSVINRKKMNHIQPFINRKRNTSPYSRVWCSDLHFTQFRVQYYKGAVVADGRQHGGAAEGTSHSLSGAAADRTMRERRASTVGYLCEEKASWFTRRAWMVSTLTGSASRKSFTVTLPNSSPAARRQPSIKTPQTLPV